MRVLHPKVMNTLYVTDRKKWRRWLREHYKTTKEIWLVYYKKETGKPRIAYNDAVEEALCFGWIDSIVRTIDEERFAQRFSPRKPKSKYSQANKFVIPKDILQAIKANKEAWKNFQKFSDSYKRIRIAFIEGARKRPQEFEKRLKHFIQVTEKNKMFGFGGIEKHY